ncbi:MAG: ACP S-malonyltransferase [Hymenobacter sp.]|nr:MAG: ACP S-malonyltransferase [Hymenobacter sp.]
MARELFEQSEAARALLTQADDILGFSLTKLMFEGTEADLRRTDVTQPAVFVHSVAQFVAQPGLQPAMVAGHSLGEFSALVAAGDVVVAANYNCPGQLVISGSAEGITKACEALKAAGAKRALPLPVGGAFHSPLMQSAQSALAEAIERTTFQSARCPVYQNVDAAPHRDPAEIKANLLAQLTAPVRWTQSVQAMTADGAATFLECGPGKVLQGLVKKIAPAVTTASV